MTQVVPASEGHVFHNRMTHSLKVAQVARRLCERILKVYSSSSGIDLIRALGGLDPDVAECAALLHDIGHPPFGHAAEYELQDCFKQRRIFDGFEGNAQSFRVASKISSRDPEYPGLDLTAASLCGLLKYPWRREGDEGTAHSVKFGYYESESDDFGHARGFLDKDERKSLEAEIMDWADDVTYAVHDLEDSFRAGMIPLDQLVMGTSERNRFIDWYVEFDAKRIAEKEKTQPAYKSRLDLERSKAPAKRNELNAFFDAQRDLIPYPVIREPFPNTRRSRGLLQRYAGFLIGLFLRVGNDSVSLGEPSANEPRLRIEKWVRSEVRILKSLMIYYVYDHPALVAQQLGQRGIIRTLFDALFNACDNQAVFAGIVPSPFREERDRICNLTNEAERNRMMGRLAADIICSMTEQQAVQFHARVMGTTPGSVREVIVH